MRVGVRVSGAMTATLSPELQQPCCSLPRSADEREALEVVDRPRWRRAQRRVEPGRAVRTYAPSKRRQNELLVASMRLYQFVRRP